MTMGLKRKKFTTHESKNYSAGGKNPTVLQNEIVKCFVLPLSVT
jgi:hypothetical protein